MAWILAGVYVVGVVFLMCVLWALDDTNQRWRENIGWAVSWPVWVPIWILAVLVAFLMMWF